MFSSFPTTVKPTSYTAPLVVSAFLSAGFAIGSVIVEKKITSSVTALENKLIEQWILKNNLNCYGESKETYYEQGSPLGKFQTRLDYIKNKFTNKPWLKDYKNIFKISNSAKNTANWMCTIGTLIAGITFNAALWISDSNRSIKIYVKE